MKTIIFDIDGTLADLNGREKFLHGDEPDWESFYGALSADLLNTPVAELYRILEQSRRYELVLISGRPERFRAPTETWLRRYQLTFDALWLRADGDFRHDSQVKQDILAQLRAQGKEILFAVEDRQSVVDMWRANGVTCLQCAKGDF